MQGKIKMRLQVFGLIFIALVLVRVFAISTSEKQI